MQKVWTRSNTTTGQIRRIFEEPGGDPLANHGGNMGHRSISDELSSYQLLGQRDRAGPNEKYQFGLKNIL